MTAGLRRVAGALVAAGVAGAIVALSRVPYGRADEAALLRLSWSGRPARIEHCRELSDSELAKLPAHMRQRVECEGRSARYMVRVSDDGVALSTDSVTGGGLRGDRSIHMLREYRLAPGAHAIAVEVARMDSTRDEDEAEEPDDEGLRRQRGERLPPRLRFDTAMRLGAGSVLLVTYDPVERRLLGITGARR
ncbi:MAG TPA: hypothetical protein VFN40_03180 [Gemmatimonadales bacterium]|nr:hypothetical protein [Gemmatimonadales bacterium]